MIGRIEGVVSAKRTGSAILSAGGVGYKIAATREALADLKVGRPASLWTHLAVREDSLDLYGFKTEEELRFFELLLTVSGVGPKSAPAQRAHRCRATRTRSKQCAVSATRCTKRVMRSAKCRARLQKAANAFA